MSEKTASQRTEAASDPVAAETQITLHAWNFRGFKRVEIPLDGTIFLVGDNSSGKSSILHLISCILRHDLKGIPFLDDDLGPVPGRGVTSGSAFGGARALHEAP